ncbi:MAG: hypothetical protein K1000chlam1_00923 [Candidatus Anoxychlamydiales bacterium]|nr:hypothetical protein [Candidatus Anoxychlamydiales bacterium]
MKFFLYILTPLLLITSFAKADNFMKPPFESSAKINVKNTILAKVEDIPISAYDVMKKLDLVFNRSFPDLVDSATSRYQFYVSGWPQMLDEIINNKLMVLDATKKELKLQDAELREEMEARFGPNILLKLQTLGLTYDEAMINTKEEMIIQRMVYYFVKSKADQKLTPSAIRNAYRLYCNENPAHKIYSYHVISIRSKDENISKKASQNVLTILKEKDIDTKDFETTFKGLEKDYKGCTINTSKLFKQSSKDLAPSHQKTLSNLEKNTFSESISQTSRFNNQKVDRIFYLKDLEEIDLKTFDEMSKQLKDDLLQTYLITESQEYFSKLKNQYHVEKNQHISKDFMPFILE